VVPRHPRFFHTSVPHVPLHVPNLPQVHLVNNTSDTPSPPPIIFPDFLSRSNTRTTSGRPQINLASIS
jgi:hypothetical protein